MKSLKVTNCTFVELCHLKDGRDGVLSVAESGKQIPFDVKRVYYIYDLQDKSAIRGKHAHKHNQQVIFCINGSFTLELDDGVHRQKVKLDSPHIGIYMDVNVWHTMDGFSENCILLVLASDWYDEHDYIRDYDEFKNGIQ
jgi:dTDP-4-dehydrorhamnose 3,5-epimerase-like enzyme